MSLSARTKIKPPISASYTVSITGGVAVNVRANAIASAWPNSYFVLYRDDNEIATSLSVPEYRDTNVLAGLSYNYAFATVNVHEIEGGTGNAINAIVPAFPVWESGWALSLDQNTSQDITSHAEDPGGLSLTYSRQAGSAPGATTVSSAGIVAVAASAAGSYSLGIRASNGSLATDTTISLVVNAVVTAPDPPTWLGAGVVAVAADEIDLAWIAPSAGPPPTSYELNRSLTGSGGWSANLVSGTGTSFNNTGLSASTQYFYRLRSVNSGLFSTYITGNATTEAITSSSADFLISAGTASWSGATLRVPLTDPGGAQRAVRAGDIIELAAGNYPRLTLTDIAPSAASVTNPNTDYVTIRGPATGKANITASSGTGALLQLNGLRFVKIDGQSQTSTADVDGKRRNIKIVFTGSSGLVQLVKFGEGTGSGYQQTRDIVMRYIEIDGNWTGTGVNGGRIAVATNGPALASAFPTSWQENMIFEDMYIHDMNAEGIYCGPNPYLAGTTGRRVPVRNTKIRRCYFVNCGGSALNPKSWFGGVAGPDQFPTTFDTDGNNSIHDNKCYRCGTDNDASANPPNGPTISCRSVKVDIYNNIVEGGGGAGINWAIDTDTGTSFPSGVSTTFTSHIYNNLVKGCGVNVVKPGINVTVSTGFGAAAFKPHGYVFSNTVLSNNGNGIDFDTNAATDSFARNNIALGNNTQISWGPITNENSKNLITGSVSTAIFVDVTGTIEAGTADFHLSNAQTLASGSVLGTDLSSTDLDGDSRVLANADKGVYEYP